MHLFQSELFRLNPASIATLAEFTLSFLIFTYFLSLRGKTRDTWLIVGYVGINTVIYLVDIGVTSSKPPVYIYFRYTHVILLSILNLYWTWCAYTYRGSPLYREAIGVIILEGIWLGIMIVNLLLQDPTKLDFSEILSLYYVILSLHIWTVIVLFRRSIIAFRHKEKYQVESQGLLNIVSTTAQSLRALALLFMFWLTCCAMALWLGSAFSYHLGQMILLLGVLILHLNYAPEVTTFQVKLISLPLATTLALLGIMPFLLYGTAPPEKTWDIIDLKVQQQLKVFVWLIPIATAFILLSFILFYQVGLLKPLNILLKGVHRIEEGDLVTKLPVYNQDELGYFAQSLNKMASSLKAAQDELENRVAERTMELQASLVRLQTTQAQLIQNEKMALLGELTAGIAHEIQNPLNFVNNFSEVCTELVAELKEGPLQQIPVKEKPYAEELLCDLTQNIEKIHHHGQRADSIVKNMLQHSRAGTGQKELTNINTLAEEYLRLAYQGMRAKDKDFNAQLVTDFDDRIGKIEVIPQDLGRVLLNLFNNAFYAIQQKKAQQTRQYQPEVKLSTCLRDGKIEIKVRDNGTGIPEELKQKIFQPFFTTKPTGQGTGLGLSLSFDIITKGHGGELKVDSKEGEYTEFIINLPFAK